MPSKLRKKVFQIQENEIQQLLFCDNSDTEDALMLDEEDIGFLEEDCSVIDCQKNPDQDAVEVTIEPSIGNSNEDNVQNNTEAVSSDDLTTSADVDLFWKVFNTSPEHVSSSHDINWGEVTLENQIELKLSPYEIFMSVANFENFIKEIVIPQSELYAQQNGHVFQVTTDEIKAYFGMTLVMGYHRLPCIRDYWSSEPDLGVPYIANVMPRRRFEEIRAYFHYNDNSLMKPSSDSKHDRAFKIRPVIEHFNTCFMAALSPTQFQSIDEHMIKFKGHNILRQYVKGKPIQWGFKMWCRCDSKTGYLFECDLYLGMLNRPIM